MGYAQTLEVIGLLHADPSFRDRFMRDAGAALAPLDLSAEEKRALGAMDRELVLRIEGLADYHRVLRIQEHAPWADPLRRPDLLPWLYRFMAEVKPRLLNREEALAFCDLVAAQATGSSPPYLAELARYDSLRLSVAWGLDRKLGTAHEETFQYPILRIVGQLDAPGWPEAAPAPTRVEFKKVPGLPAVLIREVVPSSSSGTSSTTSSVSDLP